jgi:hypothetical protein
VKPIVWRIALVTAVVAGATLGRPEDVALQVLVSAEFGLLLMAFGVAVPIALRLHRLDTEHAEERSELPAAPPLPRQRVKEGAS